MKVTILSLSLLCICIKSYQITTKLKSTRLSLSMRLKAISPSTVKELIPSRVTNEQWRSYWGVNKKDR